MVALYDYDGGIDGRGAVDRAMGGRGEGWNEGVGLMEAGWMAWWVDEVWFMYWEGLG